MARFILAILAVLIIPACDCSESWDDDHRLSIYNAGSGTVHVEIRYGDDGWDFDEWIRTFTLAGGHERVDSYAWYYRVEVRVFSDGSLIFSDVYHPEDFEDHDDRISITVHP